MPSLFRFLTVVANVAGVVYAVMLALTQFYHPAPREITVQIPPGQYAKQK